MLSCLAATIIEPNFVDAVGIDNDEIVPSSCCWIGASFAHAMTQLDAETQIVQCCMLEKIAVPALKIKPKVNNKATSNVETRINIPRCGEVGCTRANQRDISHKTSSRRNTPHISISALPFGKGHMRQLPPIPPDRRDK